MSATPPEELVKHIVDRGSTLSLWVSALVTAFSVIPLWYARHSSQKSAKVAETKKEPREADKGTGVQIRDLQKRETACNSRRPFDQSLHGRVAEVEQLMRRQHMLATAYRIASTCLTFGQFVVGGVLASSFLQDKLSKEMVGVLGLLVLVSSLVRQQFRPDLQYVGAMQREMRLRALLREAEDQQFAHFEGGTDAPSIAEIRALLSDGLDAAEEAEVRSVESVLSPSGTDPSHRKGKTKRV